MKFKKMLLGVAGVAFGALALGTVNASANTLYTIQSGDTVSEVASAFGTTVDAIVQNNGLTNPNYVYVGQKLAIDYNANYSTQTVQQPTQSYQQTSTQTTTSPSYSTSSNTTTNTASNGTMSQSEFMSSGRVNYGGNQFTYYSPDGSSTPGMASQTVDGTSMLQSRDSNGYLILAGLRSQLGQKVQTPLGTGVVHDVMGAANGSNYDIVLH